MATMTVLKPKATSVWERTALRAARERVCTPLMVDTVTEWERKSPNSGTPSACWSGRSISSPRRCRSSHFSAKA